MYLDVSPCPVLDRPIPTHRTAADHVYPGATLLIAGTPRTVVGRARALDGVLEFTTADGGVVCLHPFQRVGVVG